MHKDYYVYALIDKNFVIRYFGEGRLGRVGHVHGRTDAYKEIIKEGGETIILYDDLSKLEARSKELELISKYSGGTNPNISLINKSNPTVVVNDLPFEIADEYFELSSQSPSGLVWKKKVAKTVIIGKQAGTKDTGGYYRVQVLGKRYVVHRIVWVLYNKQNLSYEFVINHIDSNTGNNKPSNLEKVTQQVNSMKKIKTLKTKRFNCDTNGISRCEQINPELFRYRATVVDPSGKLISKSFSARKYGDELAHNLALAWRKEKLLEFYGLGFD